MHRAEGENGTWLDPEEMAYNMPLNRSPRKARAICADGVTRTCTVGVPDTYFSIPARVKVKGKTVTGYVTSNDGVYEFRAVLCGKNHAVLPEPPKPSS